MFEVERLKEVCFPEGELWIGDPSEVFSAKDWGVLKTQCSKISSYLGYACTYENGAEFCIVDTILEADTIFRVFKRDRNFEDVETSCGHLIFIPMEELETIVDRVQFLNSGVCIELEENSLIDVKANKVRIGYTYYVER